MYRAVTFILEQETEINFQGFQKKHVPIAFRNPLIKSYHQASRITFALSCAVIDSAIWDCFLSTRVIG